MATYNVESKTKNLKEMYETPQLTGIIILRLFLSYFFFETEKIQDVTFKICIKSNLFVEIETYAGLGINTKMKLCIILSGCHNMARPKILFLGK